MSELLCSIHSGVRSSVVRVCAAVVLLVIVALPALAAPAGIFTGSSTGQTAFVDPIVSPGQRSAHRHCFYGAVGVETIETSASLRTKQTTWVNQDNHTGVWIPCVYEEGRLLQPLTTKHILLYYKPISGTECVPPEDMAGVSREYGYRNTIGGGSFSLNPPASSTGPLVVTLFFRGARDFGVVCFPTVQMYIRLNVGSGPIGNITLGGPIDGVDGGLPATGMHGDYLFGWERDTFERFLEQCVRPGVACGTDPAL